MPRLSLATAARAQIRSAGSVFGSFGLFGSDGVRTSPPKLAAAFRAAPTVTDSDPPSDRSYAHTHRPQPAQTDPHVEGRVWSACGACAINHH